MENIDKTILRIHDLSVAYTADKLSVSHVNCDIPRNQITAIMGPSGCGKIPCFVPSIECTSSIEEFK